jgi:hypothetical protein
MLTLAQRIKAFAALGGFLREFFSLSDPVSKSAGTAGMHKVLQDATEASLDHNPWFIRPHLDHALSALGQMLTAGHLETWLSKYEVSDASGNFLHEVGVIMAGNIPAVGFHDFLCVLMAGKRFTGKLSSDDPYLLPALAEILCNIEKGFCGHIGFTKDKKVEADAIIATGSNNTARYFEHLYGHKPHLFRHSRNGAAVLTGREPAQQLRGLCHDVFMHFGLGCRNVAKLYLPLGFNFESLQQAFAGGQYVKTHQPYMNNYLHNKALLHMQGGSFIDQGFLLMHESDAFSSPVATLYYAFYRDVGALTQELLSRLESIQCIVGEPLLGLPVSGFGQTQQPALDDYADGVDTMQFLLDLSEP